MNSTRSLLRVFEKVKLSYSVQGMNYTPTAWVRTPKIQASPSAGQPSKDILLIKCLELGVVIGMAMACCSITNIPHLRASSGPKV